MPLLGHRIIEAMIIVGNAEDKSIYINMFTNTCYHTKPVVFCYTYIRRGKRCEKNGCWN
jgi:hypothetical protein